MRSVPFAEPEQNQSHTERLQLALASVESSLVQRIRETARDDLEWLFGESEAALGIKSNFGPFLEALASRSIADPRARHRAPELATGGEDEMIAAIDARRRPMGRASAARRLRQILPRYARLAGRHKRVLEAALEPRQVPPEVHEAFGQLAGLAKLTATARAQKAFSVAWLASALSRGDARAQKLKREASALLTAAVAAYAAGRP
jgi:hypothetical protein